MESLSSSVSPSIVLPPPTTNNPLPCFRFHQWRRNRNRVVCISNHRRAKPMTPTLLYSFSSLPFSAEPSTSSSSCPAAPIGKIRDTSCGVSSSGGGGGASEEESNKDGKETEKEEGDMERALHLDGSIPVTSDQFVKQVSSRAYDMRRHLHQTFDTSSYDVLEANPWRGASKPVYVLTQRENLLCTMKTRRNRSEVERELGALFSKGRKQLSESGQTKQSRSGTSFRMLVEDVREGVLVFEDQNDAAKYCDLLQGGGQGCEGVAEVEASSVFDICQKMRALAVLFRRGRTPPLPESLQLNLKAKKRSLEDQEDLI